MTPSRGPTRYVLYWMQQSQRARFNRALEYAVEEANARDLPVLICCGLTDGYPEANARHYAFMLEGLVETAVHSPSAASLSRSAAARPTRLPLTSPKRRRSWYTTGATSSLRRFGART